MVQVGTAKEPWGRSIWGQSSGLLKNPVLGSGYGKSQKANFITHSHQNSYESDRNRISGKKPEKGLFQQTANGRTASR